MSRRSPAVPALAALALVMTGAAAALAEGGVVPLSENIVPLSTNITPMVEVEEDEETTTITLSSDVLFDTGSATIPAPAQARIVALVRDVPEGAEVAVAGHTDDVPFSGDGGNPQLSEDRAEAVAAVISAERPDLRLTVEGFGESRPVASGDDPGARAENRRVEIRYDGESG